MRESSCFARPLQSQGIRESQTLLKSTRQHFYHKFPLIQDKLNWETFLSVRSEILGVFRNTLTADYMCSCHNWEEIIQHVQMPFSSKTENIL